MNELNPNWDVSAEVMGELMEENARLKARVARLDFALNRVCLDMEQEISSKYEGTLNYPCMQRDMDRDLSEVAEARKVLDETPQQSLAHIQAEAVEKAINYASPSCYSVSGIGNMLSEVTLYRYANQLRQHKG